MADFTATVYQNEYLPAGGTDVHAIVTVECTGAAVVGDSGSGDTGEVVVVDTSGSMGPAGVAAAQEAAAAALDQVVDGVWFAVVAGTHVARVVYPVSREFGLARMEPQTRAAAKAALGSLRADGGTAIGTWLSLTGQLFRMHRGLARAHAILLTDGRNEHETPEQLSAAIAAQVGLFQCDCRGVGDAWEVGELRRIAQGLLGTVDLIPHASEMPREFEHLMRQSMGRGVADATLRVWAPVGAEVLFVRQVSPTVEDLTERRSEVNALTGGYPTGSWGDEARDYHVAIRLPAKAIGQEQLASRVQLAVGDDVVAQGLVKAKWSDDDTLTARISPEVAHYTGQTELAEAIQDGLAARAAGDERTATVKLGRAVQLAAETGNDEATERLRKVVDIDDADTGTVRLKRSVERLDEMALDTSSTKTTRVRK